MQKLSISAKIIAGFALLALLVAVTGFVGYHAGKRINEHVVKASDHTLPSLALLLEADRDLHQALVAERTMIFVDPGAEQFKALLKEHADNLTQAAERWTKFKQINRLPAAAGPVMADYERKIAHWTATTGQIRDARRAGGQQAALEQTIAAAFSQFNDARGCINQLTEMLNQEADLDQASAVSSYRWSMWSSLGVTTLSLLIATALTWFVGIRLARILKTVVQSLSANAAETSAASGQITHSSQELAQGASTQAASLEEISASLEEVSSMVKRNAEHADKARALAQQTRHAADHGTGEMQLMTQAVQAIDESSRNIGAIIKTIDEIAFQTNLLALNAAVEAARAGEAGAGFSVVAEEVRALAHRCASAAKETSTKIEDSLGKSRHGVELSTRVAASLADINARAREVDGVVQEIASASQQQAQGIASIGTAVSSMDKVTQGNAATAEETASAAEELNAQTHCLRAAIQELNQLVGAATQEPAAGTVQSPAKPAAPRRHPAAPAPAPKRREEAAFFRD